MYLYFCNVIICIINVLACCVVQCNRICREWWYLYFCDVMTCICNLQYSVTASAESGGGEGDSAFLCKHRLALPYTALLHCNMFLYL